MATSNNIPLIPLMCLLLLLLLVFSTTTSSSSLPNEANTNNNDNENNNKLHYDHNVIDVFQVDSSINSMDRIDDKHGNSSHGNGSHGNGSHGNGSHEHHGIHVASIKFHYVQKPFILSVFMLVVVLAKIGFHHANFLSSWMPESCILILLGLVVGAILHVFEVDTSSFYYIDPQIFFLFLLPPCILEAAYGLHDKVFFDNLGTIIVYAVVGTMLNCFLVGSLLYGLAYCGAMGTISITFIQCLVFSSLIVAVDPVAVLAIFQEIGVNNVLYFLVFGESLLNDAVTVVLYNTITTLNRMEGNIPISEIGMAIAAFFTVSLGGLLIGLIFGVITALITRLTTHVKVIEPLAVLSLAYASYLTAELFHFSGIISMIGCGLIQMQYAFHNISNNSHITIKHFIKMLSVFCDCIIFMFLGIAVVRDTMIWHTGFILWTVVLCLLIRFAVTYTLTFILNKTERKRLIGTREQFIMAYGGLRGAVAFCLVAMLDKSEHKDLFRTTTIVIVFFTVFFQGITIKPLVKCLKIEGEEEKVVSLYQEINSHVMEHVLMYMEEVIGHYGYNSVQGHLNNLNDKYLKRLLQRHPWTKDEVIMEVYQKIAIQQHYESVYGFDTSSDIHIYRPELIRRKSIERDCRKMSIHGSVLADQLSRQLSMAVLEEDVVMKTPSMKFYNAAILLRARKKSETQERERCQSESATKSLENNKPETKLKIPGKQIGSRLSMLSEDNLSSTNNIELRRILNMSSQRDMLARHSNSNLLKGEEKDLMLLLNEKQQRHIRFKANRDMLTSANNSGVGSLENLNQNRRKERLTKHRTVDYDNKTVPEGIFASRSHSKRPLSSLGIPSRDALEMSPLMPLKEEGSILSVELSPKPPNHSQHSPQYKIPTALDHSPQSITTPLTTKTILPFTSSPNSEHQQSHHHQPHHSPQHPPQNTPPHSPQHPPQNTPPHSPQHPPQNTPPHSPEHHTQFFQKPNTKSQDKDLNNNEDPTPLKRGSLRRQNMIQNTSDEAL